MFIIPYVIFCAQFNQNNIQCKTINRVAKLFTGTRYLNKSDVKNYLTC